MVRLKAQSLRINGLSLGVCASSRNSRLMLKMAQEVSAYGVQKFHAKEGRAW
jgi:hypothetical protein